MTSAGATDRPKRPIAADWLALRRAADSTARDRAGLLLRELNHRLQSSVTVFDVGAGTGANRAYLAPRLGVPSRWVLLDHDAELLRDTGNAEAKRVLGGIGELAGLVVAAAGPRLVSCSALLDLLTAAELDELAAVLDRLAVPGLFSLSVDGSVLLTPRHPDDDAIAAAFNRHQARDGRPGPAAAGYLAGVLSERGVIVRQAETPWLLGAGSEPLILRLLTERGHAAVEEQPALAAVVERWLTQRTADLRAASLSVRVGHVDLLALPGQR